MINTCNLPDDIELLKAVITAKDSHIVRLEALVAALRQAQFGRKSEKLDGDQLELSLEDIEAGIAAIIAEDDAADKALGKAPKRATNRGHLPKHLTHIEEVIEPASTVCACGSELHAIGEDVAERLDVIPAQFRVIVTRRPKYACRTCEDGVQQALAPAYLIPGGIPTDRTVAHVLVSKYADHLPLYRLC